MLNAKDHGTADRLALVVARIATQHEITAAIAPTDSLVDAGLTSMAMVDLMLGIEVEFDLMIPQHEMTPQNFRSIVTLAAMIDRL